MAMNLEGLPQPDPNLDLLTSSRLGKPLIYILSGMISSFFTTPKALWFGRFLSGRVNPPHFWTKGCVKSVPVFFAKGRAIYSFPEWFFSITLRWKMDHLQTVLPMPRTFHSYLKNYTPEKTNMKKLENPPWMQMYLFPIVFPAGHVSFQGWTWDVLWPKLFRSMTKISRWFHPITSISKVITPPIYKL